MLKFIQEKGWTAQDIQKLDNALADLSQKNQNCEEDVEMKSTEDNIRENLPTFRELDDISMSLTEIDTKLEYARLIMRDLLEDYFNKLPANLDVVDLVYSYEEFSIKANIVNEFLCQMNGKIKKADDLYGELFNKIIRQLNTNKDVA